MMTSELDSDTLLGSISPKSSPKYINLDESTTKKLTRGILDTLEDDRENSRLLLSSVLQTQSVLIETVQQENLKFTDNPTVDEVWKMMDKAKIYHSKLVSVMHEMSGLAEKTKMLKVRSLQLSQLQMKHHLDQESRRAAELEMDKKIIAKVNITQSN